MIASFLLAGGLWSEVPYAPYQGIEATGWLKNAAAVLVENTNAFQVQKDGNTLLHQHTVWKVFSPAGVRALSELRVFSADGETITSLHAETIDPEGVTAPDREAYKDLTAPVAESAPIYTDIHVHSITMPAVRVGSVLVLDIEARYQPKEFPGGFWYALNPAVIPVLHQSVHVEVPAGVLFHWFAEPPAANSASGPAPEFHHDIQKTGGNAVYAFEWKNVRTGEGEVAAPPPPPRFLFSTLANWSALGQWYWRLADPQAQPDDAVRAKVAALTAGLPDDPARMRAIYSFVASRIRYVSLSFGIGTYRPHAAGEVLRNDYGDCKDKATLLIAMLRAAGMDARFALVDSVFAVEPEVAAPAQFDHVIVAVPQKQGYLFLDPTSEAVDFGSLPLHEADRDVFLVTPEGGKLVRTPPVNLDQMESSETDQIRISPGGDASAINDYDFGFVDSALTRLALRAAGEARRERVEKILARATDDNTHLVKFSSSDPDDLGRRMTLHTERRIDHVVQFDASSPSLPIWWHLGADDSALGTEIRRAPVVLTSLLADEHQKIQVTLPTGYLPQLPDSKTIVNDFARFQVTYHFDHATHTMVAEAEIRPLKQEIPASRAGECATFLRAINDSLKTSIALQIGAGASQDAVGDGMRQVASLLKAHADTQAEQIARGVLKAQPDHPTVRDSLATALLGQGKLDDAAAVLHEQVDRFPKDLRVEGLLAQVEFGRKRFPAALTAAQTQLQATPYDASMWDLKGQILLQQGDAAGALKAYAEAVRIDPLHVDGSVGQGEAQLKLGDSGGAMQSFAAAAGSDQVTSRQLMRMAQALSAAGIHLDQARTDARRALFLLQDQLNATRVEDLSPTGREALHSLPDALRVLADLSARNKDFADALAMLAVAVAMRPDHADLLNDAAGIALQAGKPQEALSYLAAAVRLPAPDSDALVKLNQAYQLLPDHSLPLNVYLVKNAGVGVVRFASLELDSGPAVTASAALMLHGGHASGSVLERLSDDLRSRVESAHFPDLQIGGRSITYAVGLEVQPPDTLMLVPLQLMEKTK